MIYSTELAKVETVTNSSKYLEAGIHENVKLTGARYATSPTDKNFVEFRFEKDGKELLHTEWEPTAKPNESDEQVQNKATNQVKRIMRILSCFYPKDALVFSGSSYKEFAKWVVEMIENANKDTLLKVKVVYNDKGYTTLPSYVKFAFIEPMEIPMGFYEEGKNDSMISELSIDQFTKPVVADSEKKEDNPLDSENKEESNDDLPF